MWMFAKLLCTLTGQRLNLHKFTQHAQFAQFIYILLSIKQYNLK